MKKLFYFIFFIISFILFENGCKESVDDVTDITNEDNNGDKPDNDSSDEKIDISGIVGSGFSFKKAIAGTSLLLSDSGSIDQVVAVPLANGDIQNDAFKYMVTAKIEEDGSFILELPKKEEVDWVLMLVNSSADKREQVVSFVSIPDNAISMIKMPIKDAVDNIDLGIVNKVEDEAIASVTLNEEIESFALNIEQLKEIARTDDIIKSVMNYYVNSDPKTELYYMGTAGFYFRNALNLATSDYSSPEDTKLDGMSWNLSTNDPIFNEDMFNMVCDGITVIGLYAPPELTFTVNGTPGFTYLDSSNAKRDDTWDDLRCSSSGLYDISYNDVNSDNSSSGTFGFHTNNYIETILPGWWTFRKESVDMAYFNFSAANPMNDEGKIVTYVPAIKINTENGFIKSIDVKWYLWDQNSLQYIKLIDMEMMKEALTFGPRLDITDYDGIDSDNDGVEDGTGVVEKIMINSDSLVSCDVTTDPSTCISNNWKYFGDDSTADLVTDSIVIGYNLNGVIFNFNWMP